MLVLSRKNLQEIVVGDNVTITVLQIRGNTVRLGISAPDHVQIRRGELKKTVVGNDSAVDLPDADSDDSGHAEERIIPIRRNELNVSSVEPETSPRQGPLNRIRQLLVAFRNDESAES